MKNLFIVLIILLLIGCNKEEEKSKTIRITDQLIELKQTKDSLVISEEHYSEIQNLSQAARDVAIYFLVNRDKWTANDYTFDCGKYRIWVANDYSFLKVWEPVQYEFNKKEKDYFWKMYKTYQREDMRLYEYEDKVEIVVE